MVSIRGFAFCAAAFLALHSGAIQAAGPHDHGKEHDHNHDNDDNHDHDEGHNHDKDHRAHGAHIHGSWEMFAALDGAQLSITIKGPLIDAIGFERTPETEEERTAIRDLQSRLITPEVLLTLDEKAKCVLSGPAQIFLPDGFTQHDIDNSEEKSGNHDQHAHEDNENKNTHTNDLEVTYSFECQSPSRLGVITMTGFDTFPAIENVDAVFLGDAKQIANRLVRSERTLAIK